MKKFKVQKMYIDLFCTCLYYACFTAICSSHFGMLWHTLHRFAHSVKSSQLRDRYLCVHSCIKLGIQCNIFHVLDFFFFALVWYPKIFTPPDTCTLLAERAVFLHHSSVYEAYWNVFIWSVSFECDLLISVWNLLLCKC